MAQYLDFSTISSVITAVGGAVAAVRISGEKAFEIFEKISGRDAEEFAPKELKKCFLHTESGHFLDEAMAVRFVAPFSFTGEDVVELHLHGGALVVSRVMAELVRLGARQALPGEFSFRAVKNGKIEISQAQAVADIIGASNESALELALEKLSGTQAKLLRELSESLKKYAMQGEVGIDFNDQDIPELSVGEIQKKIQPTLDQLKKLRDSYQRGTFIQNGVRVALVGLPNAGKSSFFNALLGEDRAIVSEIAGTTRDVLRETLTLQGKRGAVTLRLEDTAGLRKSGNRVEAMGIDRSRKAASEANLVLFLVDGTQAIKSTKTEFHALGNPSKKTLGILTKTDRVSSEEQTQIKKDLAGLGIQKWVSTSAETGEGISEAAEAIVDFCESWVHREPGEVVLTRLDHFQATESAIGHLERALSAPSLDLLAADLRQTLHALAPLIGNTLPDDILGQIFSNFCIGK